MVSFYSKLVKKRIKALQNIAKNRAIEAFDKKHDAMAVEQSRIDTIPATNSRLPPTFWKSFRGT